MSTSTPINTSRDETLGIDIANYDRGTITIGKSVYKITESTYTHDDGNRGSQVFLDGPREAVYFLRGYTNRSGLFQVISWGSGRPMRRNSRDVHIVALGDVFEVAAKDVR